MSRRTPKEMYYTPGNGAPFAANREPLGAEMDAMPAATHSNESVSTLPEKAEPKAAGSHAQLGRDPA